MTEKVCENCLYFDGGYNTCHKFPPVPKPAQAYLMKGDSLWGFPEVSSDDWCGEYFPKDPEEGTDDNTET